MRTDKDINNEVKNWFLFKLLVIGVAIGACTALLTILKDWSLTSRLLSCAGLLIVLSISFVVSMLETAATSNSLSHKPPLANASSVANIVLALTTIFVFSVALFFAYKALG